MSLTKNPHPSFTGSVALTEPDKFPHKATCNPVVLAREFPISAGRESVKGFKTTAYSISLKFFTLNTDHFFWVDAGIVQHSNQLKDNTSVR